MKISLIIIILISTNLYSQKGNIFFEVNYNTFSHEMLSEFQQEFVENIPKAIPIETLDDFPANLGFTLGYELTDINTSIFASYNTTGGKISYADFSGYISVEQLVEGYTIGGIYAIPLNKNNNINLGLRGFTTFSSLEIYSSTEIGAEINNDNINFDSLDVGLGIQLKCQYSLSFIIVSANIGYDFVFGGKLKYNKNSEAYLINNANETIKTNWSGLRTGISIAIPTIK